MSGHKLNVCMLKFSKDGRYLISAGYDRQIMIWDCSNGLLVTCLIGHADAIFSMVQILITMFSAYDSILYLGSFT